jgi:hypothetical protein
MGFHRRPVQSSVCRIAVLTSTVLLGMWAPSAAVYAQATSLFEGPVCVAPPTFPQVDTWPVAGTVSLGTIASPLTLTFTPATLLERTGAPTPISLVRVASTSTNGGRITGTGPYVYTPPSRFAGPDSFEYEISDTAGELATGVVTIVVIDVAAPTVRISAPAAGTVSGIVTITASATDNVGVASVTFFDGATQIGAVDLRSPFTATWDSRLVVNGTHSLTAVARDAAGNTTTSAAVVVNVVNTTTTASLNASRPRIGAVN